MKIAEIMSLALKAIINQPIITHLGEKRKKKTEKNKKKQKTKLKTTS
jgi:hypothetical protein